MELIKKFQKMEILYGGLKIQVRALKILNAEVSGYLKTVRNADMQWKAKDFSLLTEAIKKKLIKSLKICLIFLKYLKT